MSGPLMTPGAETTAVVTTVAPFGVLVTADGVPGLVRGGDATVGDTVRVRVVEFDDVEQRFSAVPA
ncbi:MULTISPECIES: hypothetical protein [unclassified Isoptericola]|uniref:hypothetical protein n=1 Tax=unclassified Isoptericola TaxID=2623355 RepID=UPI003658D490